MINLLRKLIAPRWTRVNDPFEYDGFPTIAGHYRVMISGDSESDGPHVYYEYPDYETWAWYEPTEDEVGGTFTGVHDEEKGMIFAWCGPFIVPKRG